MKTKKLVFNAMLAAMCTVLASVAINLGNMKITLESVPVLLAGLLFGPMSGAMVGFVGTLLYQALIYSVTITTILWVIPYVVCGGVVGLLAKRTNYQPSRRQVILFVVIAELLVTALNTGALYIDSQIYGYYSATLIIPMLLPRYGVCVGKAI